MYKREHATHSVLVENTIVKKARNGPGEDHHEDTFACGEGLWDTYGVTQPGDWQSHGILARGSNME